MDEFLNDSGVYHSGTDKNGLPVFWTDLGSVYRTNLEDLRVLLASTDLLSQALINPNFGLEACRNGMCFVYDARSLSITDFRMDIAKLMYTWSRTIPTRVARIIFIANATLRWLFKPIVNMFLGKYRDKMHFVALSEVEKWVAKEYWPTNLGGKKRPGFARWIRNRAAVEEKVWPNFDDPSEKKVVDTIVAASFSQDELKSLEPPASGFADSKSTIAPRDSDESHRTSKTNFDSNDSWYSTHCFFCQANKQVSFPQLSKRFAIQFQFLRVFPFQISKQG